MIVTSQGNFQEKLQEFTQKKLQMITDIIFYVEEVIGIVEQESKSQYLNGIYKDLAENLGLKVAEIFFEHYKGLQITFPLKFYSKEYLMNEICREHANGKDYRELSRKYGYSERWIRSIINNAKRS